jgi:hypothetical protein
MWNANSPEQTSHFALNALSSGLIQDRHLRAEQQCGQTVIDQ